jgi:molybdopterin-dependent oxidoreductase alpha subunit
MEELGALHARSERVIACWAMGLTQHENGVDNIREVVNLLLLRGQVGKPGAGACPVRGHSNVQGDRTMGIHEAPPAAFLDRLDAATGIRSPRAHGHDVVHTIEALERGEVQAFVALGGNLVAAAPDSPRVAAALRGARLTVQIATKLNRTCLAAGETALILPCLGRTELDLQASGPQFVTVEDSMSVVHRSQGRLPPAGPALRSEVAIVCGLAQATLPPLPGIDWSAFTDNYDRVRELIARVVPGFEGMNERVRAPDGFVLPNTARERQWQVEGGRARCTLVPLPELDLPAGRLRLMTVRSHDQFNTTVYTPNDRYRGVHGRRDVIFINAEDAMELGLRQGDRVDITSHHAGRERKVCGFSVVIFDIPRGDAAGYFPELNPLVPLEQRARESHTPASKSVVISLAPAA